MRILSYSQVELAIKYARDQPGADGLPLFVFSGEDGAGKTTLMSLIATKVYMLMHEKVWIS